MVVVYGVMSHKPPCPGMNSIEEEEETNYLSDEDKYITIEVGGIRAVVQAEVGLFFDVQPQPVLPQPVQPLPDLPDLPALPLPRLKRLVAVAGPCSGCGRLTSESAQNVEGELYYCYSCYDNA